MHLIEPKPELHHPSIPFSLPRKKSSGPNPMIGSQACKYKSFLQSLVITSNVNYNRLMLVSLSTWFLKVRTSKSELNFITLVTTSNFKKSQDWREVCGVVFEIFK